MVTPLSATFVRPDQAASPFTLPAVGCGIAGYTPEDVAPMFMEAASLPNVYLPQSFWTILDKYIKVV